ncbi:hypothetical protein [Streptococcus dysgalactiae]|uniref:hypothetical protein n=1 Tax=Streptococcus dysgalactiae TaxID=1334 RepID=UPI001FAA5E92|nr:hypothetical protein [Streptococcus dysgalactiae]
MAEYKTYRPSSTTTFYEISEAEGVIESVALKRDDFVEGKFYVTKTNATKYTSGAEATIAIIKSGEYFTFVGTKDTLFQGATEIDSEPETEPSAGIAGFTTIFADGKEIIRIISGNQVLWQKNVVTIKLKRGDVKNVTLSFNEYEFKDGLKYGVLLTSSSVRLGSKFNMRRYSTFTYRNKSFTILDYFIKDRDTLVLALDDKRESDIYDTFTEEIVNFS